MSDEIKKLENRIDKLLRYIELLDQNLNELKEQVETRTNVDRVETIVHNLAKNFKCRKQK